MSSFPQRLKELRVLNKLTQDELGAVLGFTRAAISGYEIARNEPSIDVIKKLADYFKVSTDYLTGSVLTEYEQYGLDIGKFFEEYKEYIPLIKKVKKAIDSNKLTFKEFNRVVEILIKDE